MKSRPPRILALLRIAALLLASGALLRAQSIYFYAKPYEVFEGDAAVFNYLPVPPDRPPPHAGRPAGVPLAQILAWKWDFNGDGVWDEAKTVGVNGVTVDQINATWFAVFDAGTATGSPVPFNTYPNFPLSWRKLLIFNIGTSKCSH